MIKSKVVLAGNPNVGKSTIFNALTGNKQHTGNWSGKTVDICTGFFESDDGIIEICDLPGTYSVISNSPEEKIARDYICFSDTDLTVIVLDACSIERNLNLALQICEICSNVMICVNLVDEAAASGIKIDFDKLSDILSVPVIGICAKNKKEIHKLKEIIARQCNQKKSDDKLYAVNYPNVIRHAVYNITKSISEIDLSLNIKNLICLKLLDNEELGRSLALKYIDKKICNKLFESASSEKNSLKLQGFPNVAIRDMITESLIYDVLNISKKCTTYKKSDKKTLRIDKLLTSKITGIPITICFLGIILWLTIKGANYPSELLSSMFSKFQFYLNALFTSLNAPEIIRGLLVDGIFGTTAWVVSVMLPPMAIFFPLFTLLEEIGLLPRLAFNFDRCFACVNSSGRQALTMCMGIGCNAVGVTGCRIFPSERERIAAIITNTFMPCNGRFGLIIILSSMYFGGSASLISAFFVMLLILIGTAATLIITKILTTTAFKEDNSAFIFELPSYRHPKIMHTIVSSFKDKTLNILLRAICVSAPAGALIWILANTTISDISTLSYLSDFFEPLGVLMGMDGTIILAFILALPANEIVLPIILMCYLSSGNMVATTEISQLYKIFAENGWTILTAVNVMLFSVLHFPCATTLKTIKAETGSIKWTVMSFLIPTATGMAACMLTNLISMLL